MFACANVIADLRSAEDQCCSRPGTTQQGEAASFLLVHEPVKQREHRARYQSSSSRSAARGKERRPPASTTPMGEHATAAAMRLIPCWDRISDSAVSTHHETSYTTCRGTDWKLEATTIRTDLFNRRQNPSLPYLLQSSFPAPKRVMARDKERAWMIVHFRREAAFLTSEFSPKELGRSSSPKPTVRRQSHTSKHHYVRCYEQVKLPFKRKKCLYLG